MAKKSLAVLLLLSIPFSASAATMDVSITDYAFSPRTVKVKRGDTVRWVNRSDTQHTATSGKDGSPDGRWTSKRLNKGEAFSHTFNDGGSFEYYCEPHAAFQMKGRIEVGEE